jgi:hypothetical protein
MITGRASDGKETFQFTIRPFVTGGFVLDIRYTGDCHENITGAGIWPTVERAKRVAEESATRLLHGASVTWSERKEISDWVTTKSCAARKRLRVRLES